jgi:hypothetical protein
MNNDKTKLNMMVGPIRSKVSTFIFNFGDMLGLTFYSNDKNTYMTASFQSEGKFLPVKLV